MNADDANRNRQGNETAKEGTFGFPALISVESGFNAKTQRSQDAKVIQQTQTGRRQLQSPNGETAGQRQKPQPLCAFAALRLCVKRLLPKSVSFPPSASSALSAGKNSLPHETDRQRNDCQGNEFIPLTIIPLIKLGFPGADARSLLAVEAPHATSRATFCLDW
jgi:hypothetical protein